MFKQATLGLTLFLFISCNENTERLTQKLNTTDTSDSISSKHTSQLTQDSITTEKLSKEFLYDTINQFDKKRNIEIVLVIPKSIKSNQKYDKSVSSYLNQERLNFMARIDTMIKEDKNMLKTVPSMFSIEPVSIFSDDKVVSYCFTIQKYIAGAAHPLFEYSSINYDKGKGRQFQFSDYFNLKSISDTTLLLNKINSAINRPAIKLERLHELDFNVNDKSVSFNFDAYELGYGDFSTRSIISKQELISLINRSYR